MNLPSGVLSQLIQQIISLGNSAPYEFNQPQRAVTNAVTALNIALLFLLVVVVVILLFLLLLLLNIMYTLLYSDIRNILKNIYVSARGNKDYIKHYKHYIKTTG